MTDLKADFARLEAEKAALLASVASLDAETLNRKPAVDAWSILQVFVHLTKAEGGTLQYIQKKAVDPKALPKAGLTAWLRVAALVIGIESPFRFKAPKGVREVPDTADLAEVLSSWAKVRDDWRAYLDVFPPEAQDRAIFRHPFVGLLGPRQVMIFMRWHVKNHARQVARIRKAIGA